MPGNNTECEHLTDIIRELSCGINSFSMAVQLPTS